MKLRSIAPVVFGVAWPLPALAQEPLSPEASPSPPQEQAADLPDQAIVGQVLLRDSGTPLPFTAVVVRGTALSVRTDEQGRFELRGLPPTPFTLGLGDPGLEKISLEITELSKPVTLHAHYESEDEQVVVVWSTLQATDSASETGVTAREIQAAPVRNAEDAMRLVPGITLVQHGSEGKGHQFFLRGFDAVHGADLEVTLEGIPLNEWSNVHGQGYLDLGFIVPEAISSLHAIKGPFADHQGAFAMAGSVDYRLGIPEEDLGVRVGYMAGTTNRHRGVITYSPREGDGRDFIALEGLHDDAFGQNRAINRGSLLGRTRLIDSPEHGTLSLLASAYFADFELPGSVRNDDVQAGRADFYGSYDDAGHGTSARSLLALRYTHRQGRHNVAATMYGGYRQLDLLENYTGFLIDPVDGDRRQQHQETFDFGVSMEDTLHLGERVAWHYGTSVHGDVFNQSQEHVGQSEQVLSTERALTGMQAISSLYTSLRLKPLHSLSITAGGRLDIVNVQALDRLDASSSDAGILAALSPRFTAGWRVADPWQLFFSYGRGFRPPEARAFSSYEASRTGISEELYDGGEPSLTHSNALELGTQYQPSRYFNMMGAGFATFVAREAVFDHVSGTNLELNRTRRLGVEVDLRSHPTSWLLLAADATLVDARFVESGNLIPFAPWLSGSIKAVVTHSSGWRAGLRFFALAPRTLPHGARGGAMTVLDATLGHHWQHFHIDLIGENVLNQKVREGEYHHASDWTPATGGSQVPALHTIAGSPLQVRLGLTVVY